MEVCRSKNSQVVHQKVADEFIAIQHYLRLLPSQLLLQMFLQLHQKIIAIQNYISARRQILKHVGDLSHQKPAGLLASFFHLSQKDFHLPQGFNIGD